MKYKSIFISGGNYALEEETSDELNEWFGEGWEYVHSICQSCSTGSNDYSGKHGPVIIILKKQDKVML